MIHLDSSVLIDGLTGPRRSQPRLRQLIQEGERIVLSSSLSSNGALVRGRAKKLQIRRLCSRLDSVPFGPAEAVAAADGYRKVKRARGREIDIAIAACAIVHAAHFWTLNPA